MTNREQVALVFGFLDYDDSTVAEIVSEMVEAVGSYLGVDGRRNLEKWLALECDPETNEWGTLEDYEGE